MFGAREQIESVINVQSYSDSYFDCLRWLIGRTGHNEADLIKVFLCKMKSCSKWFQTDQSQSVILVSQWESEI